MAETCLDNNLHNDSGTSQLQRALAALSADYVKADERNTADLLLFAKKYGSFLNNYNKDNSPDGNWSDLMGKDISVIIASVSVMNAVSSAFVPYVNTLYDCIQTPVAPYNDPNITFKYIFDFVYSLAKKLNDTFTQLPANGDYAAFLLSAIASRLAIPVNQLNGYYAYFLNNNGSNYLVNTASVKPDPLSPFDETISVPGNVTDLEAAFAFINNVPWKLQPGVIIPPADMLAGDKLNDVITNNFFTGTVSTFLNGVINIINQTGSYLNATLVQYPGHAPHYALYLSFLRLFRFAQDHLNSYTKRHLKFYYKKVLQLNNNPGLPDTAHLVFSLQKNTDQYLLKQGTQFKAGKDANNNNLFYALADDVVLNQSVVQALKSVYLVKNYDNGTKIIPQQLFASPIANSSDGHGAKITSPDLSWYPFGDLSNADFLNSGSATVGFAIASNVLFLNEGTRTITITINYQKPLNLSSSLLTGIFSAQFTGNKKWFDAGDYKPANIGNQDNVIVTNDTVKNVLVITVTLNGSAPPVIPYSPKIHGGNFTQALPMMQLTVVDYTNYAMIKSLVITSMNVDVSVDAVKNISLQNDDGKIDGSKPFKPFGEFPENGASFIIGSKEVLQKNLTKFNIHFTQQQTSTGILLGSVQNTLANAIELKKNFTLPGFNLNIKSLNLLALNLGNWQNISSVSYSGGGTLPAVINFPLPAFRAASDFSANALYDVSSVDGFIKIELIDAEYNLSNYLNNVQSSLSKTTVDISGVGTANQTFTIKPPGSVPQPLSPVASSAYVEYAANTSIDLFDKNDFPDRTNFFYHIEPFGFREMHAALTTDAMTVLPAFNLDNGILSSADTGKQSAPDNGGELWIGIANTQPGEAQSILFQVSEGSANPLKTVNQDINWYYMSGNNWIAFPDTNVNDQTNYLSESGLIIFNLPGDETINNTHADNNLLWIKAAVKGNTDAVCKLIAVLANAAKVQFVTDIPGGIYFTQNIPANTIRKPAMADPLLKQISQPYASFGGRPKESNPDFNQRVSERLRHKNRAVTSWDYERLVLQNFPQIHKVKCINHTTLKQTSQAYSELKPGDVMIVTVPDLSLVTGANPLLPFTSVGLLNDIQNYVKPLCTPFVHLHVCNPLFEAVQFDFNVYFINNNSNSTYFQQQLNTDIQKFLMPWAFGSNAADIEFGGKIEKSVVLNFVQERPYVDFVTCFKMFKYTYQQDGTFSASSADLEEAIASTARSILVPYSVNNINPTANCTCNA